jgi:hypothetical protein
MKLHILITALLLLTTAGSAAGQNISFDYDADGNMQSRYVVTLRSATMAGEEEEEEEAAASTIELPERKITIYPNPTKGRITIEITPFTPAGNLFLRLYDMGGKLIKSQKVESEQTEMEITGNPGVYLLDIHLDGEVSK